MTTASATNCTHVIKVTSMDTRRMHVVLPCELVDLAHQAAGATLSTSELIRLGLAHLAGVEPDAYEVKQGRPVEPASS